MKRVLGMTVLALALIMTTAGGDVVDVQGQVVDKSGKPVAGAEVASFWKGDEQGRMKGFGSVKTDALGQFKLACELYGRDHPVMAIDAECARGGIAIAAAREPTRRLRIEVEPLVKVRGHFTCDESGSPPGWTNVYMNVMPGQLRVASCDSQASTFALKLPPGTFHFYGYGSFSDYTSVGKAVTLEPGKDVDMGAVDLKLTPIARHYGKEPPSWRVTDARGLKKEVTLADFRGKWVVLDFWGFWCGPCVGRSLPGWIDFCEAHRADRDRFEVLAFHDPQAKNFAELDEKLKPIVRARWNGRPLPFPILLDTTGETIKNFGVRAFPTELLIDPEGHLVKLPAGEDAEEYLASKLTPIAPALKLARALDRGVSLGLSDDGTLGGDLELLERVGRVKIHLDSSALKDAGVDKNTPVPLAVGGQLSLRSWLNLVLSPFGLIYVAEEDSLRVVARTADNGALALPTERQTAENARVEEALKTPVAFDFHGESLKRVIAFFEDKTNETFLLDPADRKTGAVKPDATVTGQSRDEPLQAALAKLLAPLGMRYIVRDEAVVLTRSP